LKNITLLTITFFALTLSTFSQSKSPLEREKLIYANEKLKSAIQEKDTVQLGEAYYLLGKIEESNVNFQKSNEYFLKSLKIQEKRNDFEKIARLYLRLSETEFKQNHYKESVSYARKAMEYQNQNPLSKNIGAYYNALGQIHHKAWTIPETGEIIKVNFDSALYYYKKTEQIELLQKDEINLARVRLQIGSIYIQLKDKRAIPYLQQAVFTFEKDGQQSPLLNAMLCLAGAYLGNQQNEKAFNLLQNVDTRIQNGYSVGWEVLANLEHIYTEYYKLTGDWKKAYEHYYRYHQYVENALLKDRSGAVSELNIVYDTEKKQTQIIEQKREIALQEEVLTLQKRFLWLVGTLLILTIIVGYIFFRLYKKNQELSKRNSILLQEQNHRVKNNLQVISSLLSLQSNQLEDEKAKQAVDESQLRIEAITILHRQLYDKHEGLDMINMEDFIMDLSEIILQTYNLSDVEIEYDITLKEINNDKTVFIGLIINELISNACKYAFQGNDNPYLKISFSESLPWVNLKVKDNGKLEIKNAINFETNPSSFGMKLIKMMVLQLDGIITYSYDEGSEFTIKFKEF
jgi:two-component system, sensor histidine kinase PdtaS